MKLLYNTSINIFISLLSMLYLQRVLLIHLKKCVFYINYKYKLPLFLFAALPGPPLPGRDGGGGPGGGRAVLLSGGACHRPQQTRTARWVMVNTVRI